MNNDQLLCKNILENIINSEYSNDFLFTIYYEIDYIYSLGHIFSFVLQDKKITDIEFRNNITSLLHYKKIFDKKNDLVDKHDTLFKFKDNIASIGLKGNIKKYIDELIDTFILIKNRQFNKIRKLNNISLNLIDKKYKTLLFNYLYYDSNSNLENINLLKTEQNLNIFVDDIKSPLYTYINYNNEPTLELFNSLKNDTVINGHEFNILSIYLIHNINPKLEIIEQLINNSVKSMPKNNILNKVDDYGRTLLMLYLTTNLNNSSPEHIKLLKTKDNINMQNDDNNTPLDYYKNYTNAENQDIINLLTSFL